MASNTVTFQPAFTRIPQAGDFDDVFACTATVVGKTLAEVKQKAIEKCKHPKYGPYAVPEEAIIRLFAQYGYVVNGYKPLNGSISDIPADLALLWIPNDPDNDEIGRTVVFHRLKVKDKAPIEYVIDPAYWVTDHALQYRTEHKALCATWWIGIYPTMEKTSK